MAGSESEIRTAGAARDPHHDESISQRVVMESIVSIAAPAVLVLLDIASLRWDVDSRERLHPANHELATRGVVWESPYTRGGR